MGILFMINTSLNLKFIFKNFRIISVPYSYNAIKPLKGLISYLKIPNNFLKDPTYQQGIFSVKIKLFFGYHFIYKDISR